MNAKTGGTPHAAIRAPAMAGPAARATLTLIMSSRVAAAICDRGTSSVIDGCQVGSCRARPAPTRNVNASSSGAPSPPDHASTANNTAIEIAYT